MPVPLSLIVFMGLATTKVPSAEPQMITYSHGCQITPTCPPMAMKPPSRQPSVITRPMMIVT